MEEINNFKHIVTKNLVYYRKKANLTQLELAEKINYSDKAVSKWERGETLPDIYILKQLADIYGITVDSFLNEKQETPNSASVLKQTFINRRLLITSMSIGLAWLLATIVYVILLWAGIRTNSYLAFIFAIPVTAIIGIVFTGIWRKHWIQFSFVSLLVWSTLLSIFLLIKNNDMGLIFIIGAPLQILVILWYLFINETTKIKWQLKLRKKEKQNKKNDGN